MKNNLYFTFVLFPSCSEPQNRSRNTFDTISRRFCFQLGTNCTKLKIKSTFHKACFTFSNINSWQVNLTLLTGHKIQNLSSKCLCRKSVLQFRFCHETGKSQQIVSYLGQGTFLDEPGTLTHIPLPSSDEMLQRTGESGLDFSSNVSPA